MTKSDAKTTKKPTAAAEINAIKDDCALLHALIDEQNETMAAMRAQIQHLNARVFADDAVVEKRQRFG